MSFLPSVSTSTESATVSVPPRPAVTFADVHWVEQVENAMLCTHETKDDYTVFRCDRYPTYYSANGLELHPPIAGTASRPLRTLAEWEEVHARHFPPSRYQHRTITFKDHDAFWPIVAEAKESKKYHVSADDYLLLHEPSKRASDDDANATRLHCALPEHVNPTPLLVSTPSEPGMHSAWTQFDHEMNKDEDWNQPHNSGESATKGRSHELRQELIDDVSEMESDLMQMDLEVDEKSGRIWFCLIARRPPTTAPSNIDAPSVAQSAQVRILAKVGSYVVALPHRPELRVVSIHSVCTAPDERRRGLATYLLGAVLQHWREQGVQLFTLIADRDENAIRLYQRLGFVTVGSTVTFMTYPGIHVADATAHDDPK